MMPTRSNTLNKALWYSLLLYVALLGTMKPEQFVFGQRMIPADVVFVLVSALFAANLFTGSIKLKLSAVLTAVLIYLGTMSVSAVFSAEPARSGAKIVGVCYLAVIAVVTSASVDSIERLRSITLAYLVGSTVAVLIGLFTTASFYIAPTASFLKLLTHHYGSVPVGNYPRISSTFISPSMLMNYLSVSLVLLILARVKGWISMRLFILGAAATAVCCIFTFSIGLGALFLIAALLLEIFATSLPNTARRSIQGGCLAAAVAFVAIAPFALQPHFSPGQATEAPLTTSALQPSARLLVWNQAIATFSSDPLTGIGVGLPVAHVVFRNTDGTLSRLTDAHNVFLSVAGQAGLFGIAGVLLLCVQVLRTAFRKMASTGNSIRVASLLGIAFIIAFLYQGLTGSFEDARHLWLVIGLIPAATRLAEAVE